MAKKIVVVIPARMASSRFPGKPLVRILDLPMIEHVRRRALLAEGVDEVVVATCDREIMETVIAAGGKAVMTSDRHERSTERVAEAMQTLAADIVVVVQGDEPTLFPDVVRQVAAPLLERDDVTCVSLLSTLETEADYGNPNIVKASCDRRSHVMYFSRAPIPYYQKRGECPIYRETGIRAFRADFLQVYPALPETPFEHVEAVDMLRLLEHGYRVFGVIVNYTTLGVDHQEDVTRVEHTLRTDPVQKRIYRQTLEMTR